MEVIIRPDARSAVKLTARIIADDLKKKPDMVFGLATGRTMEAVYAELARLHKECGVDFSLAKSFNLDEYIGLAPENKNSYRYYMNYHLFNNVNIDLRNTHLPDGIAEDLDAEGPRYEQVIADAGGIDLQLLGIGCDGHIGFNEPLSSLASRTRQKALTPETYEQNSPLFDNPQDMPKRAFTMGVGTILDAKRIVMLVTGPEKAEILAKAVEGPVTSMISASALQLHPRVVIIADEDAAVKLEGKNYYRWIFQNEPEWEPYRSM
ncbi:glucosamine-6-phosphate deaminase [Lentisphaerota bacterium ZTH]|nr:glucosamine-6-phosphate deaminase [Lentisphaerota bacterium]WET05527.1 glucosamine-6-phosphate deaminase [Lentisphaerota bacterium ZTH]